MDGYQAACPWVIKAYIAYRPVIESKPLEGPKQWGGSIGLLDSSFLTQLLEQLIDLQPRGLCTELLENIQKTNCMTDSADRPLTLHLTRGFEFAGV